MHTGFKEEVGAVDAMEEEMGTAAAADADHERVSKYSFYFLLCDGGGVAKSWLSTVFVYFRVHWYLCALSQWQSHNRPPQIY